MARSKSLDEFTKPTGTVIGIGFTINAASLNAKSGESMRIDGKVYGDVEMDGVLNLSETGLVEGNVVAGSVRVAGVVHGDVHCKNILHLAATAKVSGTISTSTLIVDDGAIMVGRCTTRAEQHKPIAIPDKNLK